MTGSSHLTIVRGAPPSDIARIGAGLLALGRPEWLAAEIVGGGKLLGRWQRSPGAEPFVRRLAGGRTLELPGRAVLVLCALPRWDALGAPDPGRVINRHVRPLRATLSRLLKRPVAYLGRDNLVTDDRTPVAWIGQASFPGGATLLEAIVVAEVDFDALVRLLAEATGAPVRDDAAPPLGEPPPEEDEAGFVESGAVEVPIGRAEALVRHDGARVIAARLRGDVQGSLDVLGDALAGVPLDAGAVHAALARAQTAPDAYLFGVRDASVFADLVVATRARALAALAEKYAVLAALRARRDARCAGGLVGFDEDELAARGKTFRAVAGRFPGALRELEAHSAATLATRAQAVLHAHAAGRPVAEPWIRAVLDFHGTLAAALAARRRGGPRLAPRPRILDAVFDELAARHDAPRPALEAMVFGAARRER